jgi:hypothetical protein
MCEKIKSRWCLLVDVPACLLIVPFTLVGMVFVFMEIGYIFGRHHTEKWFMRSYNKTKE